MWQWSDASRGVAHGGIHFENLGLKKSWSVLGYTHDVWVVCVQVDVLIEVIVFSFLLVIESSDHEVRMHFIVLRDL